MYSSGDFLFWLTYSISTLTYLCVTLQFVGLESIMTSLTDVYPAQIRKGYRRELYLMLMCALCYAFGLLFVSQVSCKDYICIRNAFISVYIRLCKSFFMVSSSITHNL